MASPCLTLNIVLKQFREAHGDLYDYCLVDYVNGKTKVDIICKVHGVFSQRPRKHKEGIGCPECAKEKYYNDRKCYLYYIKIKNQYKIGVCLKKNYKSINSVLRHRQGKEINKGY